MKLSFANTFTLFVFAALLILAIPAWAGIIYTQPWSGTSDLYASQNDTGVLGHFAETYNQFTLLTSSNIAGVNWTGGYFNPPTQGPITAWTVNFYADIAGIPGPLLASFVSNGAGNETFINPVNGFPFYSYSVNGTSFFAVAGNQYWLSVVPDLGFQPQWGWGTSPTGSGNAYQCFFGSCGYLTPIQICNVSGACDRNGPQGGVNLAFDLVSSVDTPEPSSLILLSTGVIGLADVIRRKLQRRTDTLSDHWRS